MFDHRNKAEKMVNKKEDGINEKISKFLFVLRIFRRYFSVVNLNFNSIEQ